MGDISERFLDTFVRRGNVFSPPLESSLDRSERNIHLAIADFTLAIMEATTVEEAVKLSQRLGLLRSILEACEDAAIEKAYPGYARAKGAVAP